MDFIFRFLFKKEQASATSSDQAGESNLTNSNSLISIESSSTTAPSKPASKRGHGRARADWFVSNPITNWFYYNKDASNKQIDEKHIAEDAFYEACFKKFDLKSCNVNLTDLRNDDLFKEVQLGLNKPVTLTYDMKYEFGLLTSNEWKKHKNNNTSNSSSSSSNKKTIPMKETKTHSSGNLRKQKSNVSKTKLSSTSKNSSQVDDTSSSKSFTSIYSAFSSNSISPPKSQANNTSASKTPGQKLPEKQTFMENFFKKTPPAEKTDRPMNLDSSASVSTDKPIGSDPKQKITPKATIFNSNFFKPIQSKPLVPEAPAAGPNEKVLAYLMPKTSDQASTSLSSLAENAQTGSLANTDQINDKFKSLYDQFRTLQPANNTSKRKRELPDAIHCDSSSSSSLPSLSLDTEPEASLSPPPSKRNFFNKEIGEASKTLASSLNEQSNKMTPNGSEKVAAEKQKLNTLGNMGDKENRSGPDSSNKNDENAPLHQATNKRSQSKLNNTKAFYKI
jgi:hypothetical protein